MKWSEGDLGFYVNQYHDPKLQDSYAQPIWIEYPKGREKPIKWDPRQRRVLEHVFQINEAGQLPYVELYWIDIGKSAKTLLQAALCQWMGMFVASRAELLLAANSREQSGVRCYRALTDSISWNPKRNMIADVLDKRIKFYGTDNECRPVAMKAKTASGGNAIFIGFDEMWGYEGELARDMVAEMKASPTRNISFIMVTSYPPFEGDDGPLNDALDLFFKNDDTPKEGVEKVEGLEDLPFWTLGDTAFWWNHAPYPWHTPAFMNRQRTKATTRLAQYLRIWEARRTARSDAFIPLDRWDECEDAEWEGLTSVDRDIPMVIAADVSIRRDGSACVARTYNPDTRRFDLLAHKIWKATDHEGNPRDMLGEIEQWILDKNMRHKVLRVYYDPHQAEGMARNLEKAKIEVAEFTQNNMRKAADTGYFGHIVSKTLRNYPQCRDLREHVAHAIGVEDGMEHVRLDKRKSSHQIDGAVADSMCCFGVQEMTDILATAWRRKSFKTRLKPARPNAYKRIYRMGITDGRS